MNASPPAVSIRLLALVLPWEVRDDVLGDLVERYGRRVERDGLPRARMWWARETRRLILVAGRERLRDLFPRRRTDDPDSPKQRYNLMHELFQDARYALHGMMARPAQSAAMVITMVLGIGATTAVFNVVNGVLLSPSPYPDAEQLVLVYEVDARADIVRMDNPVAAANYGDWREMNQVFSGMAHYGLGSSRVGTDDGPERVETAWVAPTFFETVGIRPAQGRAFVETDGSPEAAPVVVLGYDYWERRFGGDPSVPRCAREARDHRHRSPVRVTELHGRAAAVRVEPRT